MILNKLPIKTRSTIAHPSIINRVSGKVVLEDGLESIHTSLKLLLLTSKGELLGDPNYGTDLRALCYLPRSQGLEDQIKQEILSAITMYERRIELRPTDIDIYYTNQVMHIVLHYRLIRTDITDTLELVLTSTNFSSTYLEEANS